jgi:hypothetical protein
LDQLLVNCALFAVCLLPSLLVARALKDPAPLTDDERKSMPDGFLIGENDVPIAAPARTGSMGRYSQHSRGSSLALAAHADALPTLDEMSRSPTRSSVPLLHAVVIDSNIPLI